LKQISSNLDFTKTQPDVNLRYITSGFEKFVIFPGFDGNLSLYEMSYFLPYLYYRNNSDMLSVSERIGTFRELRYIADSKYPHNQSYHSGISYGTRPTNTVWIHRY
jgi:hypothetical protein